MEETTVDPSVSKLRKQKSPNASSHELRDISKEENSNKRKRLGESVVTELYNAKFNLKPNPKNVGKYKLEIIKVEGEEVGIQPDEHQNSRLHGWVVEIRRRADGRQSDKYYYHLGGDQRLRSTVQVINYILHGSAKMKGGEGGHAEAPNKDAVEALDPQQGSSQQE